MLIVFEGIDGCGKETQIKLLKEKLGAVVLKYPTKNNRTLNDYLEKKISIDPKALFLLFLDDITEDQKSIKKALAENKYVILDRYIFSTIAYELDSFSYSEAKQIVEKKNLLKPDMVILLDIDEKTSQERKSKQKKLDRYEENAEYLKKVRNVFLKLFEERFLTPSWHKIDARKDIASVQADLVQLFM
ncbi:Thymidylate kinase [Candidatus Bilamarchaeum dharawalense]|uniref:Probable thymidylate kinase n=1 Tax=Candidatus Bilamarchaeum dharawalense TaxID=2885759 RepID=A0A5E4LNY6_9ARCH|nr:Thymidylate kinase [Candidatus Bilamarchaeum dharawalense]